MMQALDWKDRLLELYNQATTETEMKGAESSPEMELMDWDQVENMSSEKERSQDLFSAFPIELKISILQYLNVEDLLKGISRVNSEWNKLTNEPMMWKDRFNKDKYLWTYMENTTNQEGEMKRGKTSHSLVDFLHKTKSNTFSFLSQVREETPIPVISDSSEVNWRQIYLQQYFGNQKRNTLIPRMKISNPSKLNIKSPSLSLVPQVFSFSKMKIKKVAMFGEGIHISAKKLLYKMMDQQTPFPMIGAFPGVGGLGTGISFNVNDVQLDLSAMHAALVDEKLRCQWKSLFGSCDGFVLAIDSSMDLNQVKNSLEDLFSSFGISPNAALLILNFENDAKKLMKSNGKVLKAFETVSALQLENWKDRKWLICNVSMENMEGIWQGWDWLASNS